MRSIFPAVLLIALSCCVFPSSSATVPTSEYQALPKCVYLKHAHFDEYMFTASADVIVDSSGSRVFTWMRKSDGPARDWAKTWGEEYRYQGVWHFQKENTCNDCYTVKSAFNEDNTLPLYSAKVERMSGTSDHLRIKINFDGQFKYIYVSDFNRQNRRNVFTWGLFEEQKVDTVGGLRDWIMEKAECPPYVI